MLDTDSDVKNDIKINVDHDTQRNAEQKKQAQIVVKEIQEEEEIGEQQQLSPRERRMRSMAEKRPIRENWQAYQQGKQRKINKKQGMIDKWTRTDERPDQTRSEDMETEGYQRKENNDIRRTQ